MTVICRILKSEDVPYYRALRLESLKRHPECYGSNYEDEHNASVLFFEEQIKIESSQNLMMGAYINDILVGLCGLITTEANQFLIVQMYVTEAYKGQKIGQSLLSKAKSLLLQYQRSGLLLTVYESNKPALKLYLRAGFHEVSRQGKEIMMYYQP